MPPGPSTGLRRHLALGLAWGGLAVILLATLLPGSSPAPPGSWPRFLAVSPQRFLSDAIQNVLLFLPLGLGIGLRGRPTVAWLSLCGALSLTVELLQGTLIPGRTASLADIATNVTGAALGLLLGHSRTRFLAPSPHRRILLAGGWLLLQGALALAAPLLFAPSAASTPVWWGQWGHVFPSTSPFPGSIHTFAIGGIPIPDGPVPHTADVKERFASGRFEARFELTARGSSPAAAPAQVVALTDGAGTRLLEVRNLRSGWEVAVHRRAHRFGLTVPALFFPVTETTPDLGLVTGEVAVNGTTSRLTLRSAASTDSRAMTLGALDLPLTVLPLRRISGGELRATRVLWLGVIVGPVLLWLTPLAARRYRTKPPG